MKGVGVLFNGAGFVRRMLKEWEFFLMVQGGGSKNIEGVGVLFNGAAGARRILKG